MPPRGLKSPVEPGVFRQRSCSEIVERGVQSSNFHLAISNDPRSLVVAEGCRQVQRLVSAVKLSLEPVYCDPILRDHAFALPDGAFAFDDRGFAFQQQRLQGRLGFSGNPSIKTAQKAA